MKVSEYKKLFNTCSNSNLDIHKFLLMFDLQRKQSSAFHLE